MAGYLAQILEDMLSEAMQRGKSHRKLSHGLHIKLQIDTDGNILTLARELVYPELREWDTVIKSFPYAVPSVLPQTGSKGKYLTISAKLPTRKAEQLKFG